MTSQIRQFIWPVMGWSRLGRYIWFRLLRLKAAPHAIALGAAFGVFASFTPFIGAHVALALVLAYLFGGNLVAAGLGTIVGNPLTFPFIWLASYNIGGWLMGEPVLSQAPAATPAYSVAIWGSLQDALPMIAKMMVGSFPLGVLAAVLCYIPVKTALVELQHRRRQERRRHHRAHREARRNGTPALS